MPTSTRGQAVADMTAPALTWDGTEIEESGEYDDYLNAMPPKDDLKLYPVPARYWEVRYPGCTLQPFPRMAGFSSDPTGLWESRNKAQEEAVRVHVRMSTQGDPDLLRISDDEWAVMNGKVIPGMGLRFCQDCTLVTSSLFAANLHEELCQHSTKSTPRKDR